MIDNSDGYTLVPEAIARECGPAAALVWGIVWGHCQMAEGICWVSQAAIGRRAGLRRETVNRHLRRLVQAGYLTDLSPDAQGSTRAYADTGRAGLSLPAPAPRPLAHTPVGRAPSPPLPPPADDDPYDDLLYEQDDASDEDLLVELLADHFSRLTGLARPTPRNDRQLREARALWSDPLRRIAAFCGSAAVGRRAITAALTTLRDKGCVVKAPISIMSTAEALVGRQRARRLFKPGF